MLLCWVNLLSFQVIKSWKVKKEIAKDLQQLYNNVIFNNSNNENQ